MGVLAEVELELEMEDWIMVMMDFGDKVGKGKGLQGIPTPSGEAESERSMLHLKASKHRSPLAFEQIPGALPRVALAPYQYRIRQLVLPKDQLRSRLCQRIRSPDDGNSMTSDTV